MISEDSTIGEVKYESTSLSYYNLLPGNKLPLDIRSIIVSFISIVPINC